MTAQKTTFGHTAGGTEVTAITLGTGPLRATVLTWGAVVQDVRLAGVPYGLTLGSPDLAAYEGPMVSFGALMGPVANRIRGARAPIAGQEHRFEANLDGIHTLHGGSAGTQARVWDLREASADHVVLETVLDEGLGGFPGRRVLQATYRVTDTDLDLEIAGTTDAPTLLNIANHSYWNLDGGDHIGAHHLEIAAERYTVTGPDLLVTGEVAAVAGTRYDFRVPRPFAPGPEARFDLNFALADAKRALSPACTLTGQSGLRMEMFTTEPGLQVFDLGSFDTTPFVCHSGRSAPRFSAIALEAQGWPDAPNHPGFPAIEVTPGAPYHQHTRWRFSAP